MLTDHHRRHRTIINIEPKVIERPIASYDDSREEALLPADAVAALA